MISLDVPVESNKTVYGSNLFAPTVDVTGTK